MDATKLIEEAGRWAGRLREGPAKDEASARLMDYLAAALKASEERARKAEELAAANLAANKRIVELEHERDAARAELARLTTPRPIAEAPRDGTVILGLWAPDLAHPVPVAWMEDLWLADFGPVAKEPSHYLPLPEVKP